jgi:hypothetical protein
MCITCISDMQQNSGVEFVYKTCPNCGHMNADNVEICSACGVNILGFAVNAVNIQDTAQEHQAQPALGGKTPGKINGNRGGIKNKDQSASSMVKSTLVFLFFAGVIVVLTSAVVAYALRSRREAAEKYFSQAVACSEQNDPACAQAAIKKAQSLGYSESLTSPILAWSLEQDAKQFLLSGQQDAARQSAVTCLDTDASVEMCRTIICTLDRAWITHYLQAGDWGALIGVLDSTEAYCPHLSDNAELREQAFRSWYKELWDEQQYLRAMRVRFLWFRNNRNQ